MVHQEEETTRLTSEGVSYDNCEMLRKTVDIEEDYDLCELLGKGTSGSVYRLVNKETNEEFAGKLIDVSTEENRIAFDFEVKRLLQFQSQATVQLFAVYYTGTNAWIVMELCAGGSLLDLMNARGKPLEENEIKEISAHILLGLQKFHAAKCAHRVRHNLVVMSSGNTYSFNAAQDLKSSNILLSASGQIKLCDFGEAEGTLHWMAPGSLCSRELICWLKVCLIEVLDSSFCADDTNMMPSDIWSLGITVIELSEGKVPYAKAAARAKVANLILQSPPPSLSNQNASSEMIDFVSKCLQKSPESRMTAAQLMHHPWILETLRDIESDSNRFKASGLLTEIYHSISEMKRQKEEQNRAFLQEQEMKELKRIEEEKEEISRLDMEEAEKEMLEFIKKEKDIELYRIQKAKRLELERIASEEESERLRVEKEKRNEKRERNIMESEDLCSKVVGDEVRSKSAYCFEGLYKKRSEHLGMWNPRFISIDRMLLCYFDNEKNERNRYLITPNTSVTIASDVALIRDSGNPGWEVKLCCSQAEHHTLEALKSCLHNSIRYASDVFPLHYQKRALFAAKRIKHSGWVKKKSEYLGRMNKRFLVVNEGILSYYDRPEDQASKKIRGQYYCSATSEVLRDKSSRGLLVRDNFRNWEIFIECGNEDEAGAWEKFIQAHIELVS